VITKVFNLHDIYLFAGKTFGINHGKIANGYTIANRDQAEAGCFFATATLARLGNMSLVIYARSSPNTHLGPVCSSKKIDK
jgi:hypothetical protein